MAKRRDEPLGNVWAGLSLRAVLLNPASLVLVATAITIGITIYLWNLHQAAIAESESYILTADRVTLRKHPAWDAPDLVQMVIQPEPGEDSTSLLDEKLVGRTVNRFQKVGWVESVNSVTKSAEGLTIDLSYRQPVGLVELNSMNVRRWKLNQREKLLAVDRAGVVLPDGVIGERAMLRLTVFEPQLSSDNEEPVSFVDDRVQGCAEIASLLGNRWEQYGLARIMTFRPPQDPSDTSIPFQIWTGNRSSVSKIIWGSPPGKELAGEARADQKLALIEKLFVEKGKLSELPPMVIDLRTGKLVISKEKTAERPAFEGSLIK